MRELTIDSYKANLMGIVFMLPVAVLFAIPYYFLWHQSIDIHNEIVYIKSQIYWVLAIAIIGIIFHELLHGLAYVVLTKGDFKNISFGIIWQNLTPYCHYSKEISIKQYRIALITPVIPTGIIPLIIALFTGNFLIFIFGVLFTLGAIGDFMILWILRKEKAETIIKDHPDEIGCIIIEDD
jgi:hypothetical protein